MRDACSRGLVGTSGPQNTGFWIMDLGRLLATSLAKDIGVRRSWTLDFRPQTLDRGLWTVDLEPESDRTAPSRPPRPVSADRPGRRSAGLRAGWTDNRPRPEWLAVAANAARPETWPGAPRD